MSNPDSDHQEESLLHCASPASYDHYEEIPTYEEASSYPIPNIDIAGLEDDEAEALTPRLETSSSAPGASSSRRRHAGRTSSRRNASGSSGSGHSGGSERSTGAGRSSDEARSSRAGSSGSVGCSTNAGGPSGGRGGSSSAGASRESGKSTQYIWQCHICHRNYRSRPTLREHTRTYHQGPYRCRVGCQQEFTNAGNRNRHERTVHTARENAPCKCSLCNCSFRIERDLKHHYRSEHPNNS